MAGGAPRGAQVGGARRGERGVEGGRGAGAGGVADSGRQERGVIEAETGLDSGVRAWPGWPRYLTSHSGM